MGGLDSFGGGLDELSHVSGVGDHRHLADRDYDGDGPMRLANCCTAYMTRALTESTSAAKWWTKSSSGSLAASG